MADFVEGEDMTLKKNHPAGYNGITDGVIWQQLLIFFFPMQLGAREGGLALAVDGLHMSPALGVYVGLITRIRELLWIAIGMALIKIGNKK